MASFGIQFIDRNNKLVDEISVVGKKVRDDNDCEHYYIAKPNAYGIKWVMIGRDGRPDDVCFIHGSEKDVLQYDKIRILK